MLYVAASLNGTGVVSPDNGSYLLPPGIGIMHREAEEMNQSVWKAGASHLLRYGLAILCLLLCFAVEWEMIDRFTVLAYEKRYASHLEEFRQNPVSYCRWNPDKEAYEQFFDEQLANVEADIVCFPIEKSYMQDISYEDSWYGTRTYGGERRHEGTDLMSRIPERGQIPVVSMTDGTVKNIGWLTLGGWRIGIESERGMYYYYAHLYSYAPNLNKGDTVYAGQLLGFMGDSGYGEEGTVGMFDVHLHLGIYMYDSQGTEISMNPYPFLRALQGLPYEDK